MKTPSLTQRTQLLVKYVTVAVAALSAAMVATAQQTVFYDTFGSSSLNQTNITGGIPGGTPSDAAPFTASSYTIGSAKDARATAIGSGHLRLIQGATSSGNLDAQALFTKYPITLASLGDYIELTYTFTETPPILMSFNGTASALFLGLFNSHGSAPWYGDILQNTKYSTTASDAVQGHTANWSGFNAEVYNGNASRIRARPVQTSTANNYNQSLLYNYPTTGGLGPTITVSSPNLATNQQYTMQLRVTLTAEGTLTVSNALYSGTDTSGTLLFGNQWTNITGASVTTNFDGLAIGFRANNTGYASPWTNDVNNIKVVASLAAQAGPYFFVTSSGDPCEGGLTIGLSGSAAATNVYMLYTNGVDTGLSVLGTGAAIDFGLQTNAATYTVIASNTVTASVGPMYGSASVFAIGITITNQPASVSVVTNLPTSFTVGAAGNALSYQWYKNEVALTNGGTISGATNATLNMSAVQSGDDTSYYVVVQDPCGSIVTSTPPATLTLTAPNDLTWSGNSLAGIWDHSALNFNSDSTAFSEGDNVTFTNGGNGSVTISNDVTPTLMTVSGSQSYTFSGPNKIAGVAKVVDSSTDTLTFYNANDYTGGTIVESGATLQLGDGSTTSTANNGSIRGPITVNSGGNLNYNFGAAAYTATVSLNNTLAGTGTNNCSSGPGLTIATALTGASSNFTGTINIIAPTVLHAVNGNQGYAFGNGSTVNVPDQAQVWLDPSATSYNNTFNIAGNGWVGADPAARTGALRIWNCIVNGPVNLTADARIGGTIGGGTIQSVISGSYRLEVWGTTNSFVLVMGPTNGSPQAYASTLITAGAIRAANINAISSSLLTIGEGGDFQLFGNNVTVTNLASTTSASGGLVTLIEGPRIRNMNTTNAAILTVGGDGINSQFDGTLSDGAAASLGLTKVGGGSLTLTLLSSNTGPVTVAGGTFALTGSGALSRAPIVIRGGAFNVSGIGGTLTLNSGQFIKGDGGTLSGALSAPAGSIVNPGFPMGTLTVSGTATVNGTYRANLNRTNVSNCSHITASSVTFSGATLSVTNVGPRLQVGDAFQLFSGATAGFSTFSPQTVDTAHNAVYMWDNTVATDGKVTMTNVSWIINPDPTNVTIVPTNNGVSLFVSWPLDHKGWLLQAQTNTLAQGLGTNWVNVTNSVSTNSVVIPIGRNNGSVYYRMVFTNTP